MYDDPFPVGDPAGMRALAAQFSAAAEALDARVERSGGSVRSLTFEGPKAARFRDHAATTHARGRALAGEMRDLSARLVVAATRVEHEISAWHARRLAALAREQS